MISVDMSSLWSDETDLIVRGVTEATENIEENESEVTNPEDTGSEE